MKEVFFGAVESKMQCVSSGSSSITRPFIQYVYCFIVMLPWRRTECKLVKKYLACREVSSVTRIYPLKFVSLILNPCCILEFSRAYLMLIFRSFHAVDRERCGTHQSYTEAGARPRAIRVAVYDTCPIVGSPLYSPYRSGKTLAPLAKLNGFEQ